MIFNIFKSKPTLKELIPNGFIDIHSHILPGIDDGPKNINQSLELINEMKKIGFSKIIGTPHTYAGVYDNSNNTIKKSYDKLKKELNEDIILEYASEYMLDEKFLKRLEEKSLLTINYKYILIEIGFIAMPNHLYEIIFKIQTAGFIPILAHPERYIFLLDNFEELVKLKKVGCKFQINLLSTIGYYGSAVTKMTDKLLKKNMVDFVGSDIHSKKHINMFNNKIRIKEIEKLKKSIESNKKFR